MGKVDVYSISNHFLSLLDYISFCPKMHGRSHSLPASEVGKTSKCNFQGGWMMMINPCAIYCDFADVVVADCVCSNPHSRYPE